MLVSGRYLVFGLLGSLEGIGCHVGVLGLGLAGLHEE